MKAWHTSHYARWFAVARADKVKQTPMAIMVLDQPIVLARLASGELLALEDRCPHRHAPLSSGCLTSSGIRCPYHGWSFSRDGALQEIPGMPATLELPSVRAKSFAVQEHDGLIWLRPGDAEQAEDLPFLVKNLTPSTQRFLWQTRWDANIVDAMENFLDPMHTHSIHPGLVRNGAKRIPTRVEFTATKEGFCVDYSQQEQQSGLLFRLFESKRSVERAHFAMPGSAQIEYRYAKGGVVRITLHFTPCAQDKTDVFASLHVEDRWSPKWAVRMFVWPFLRRVGEQDQQMLRLQSENLKRFPNIRGASTQLDIVRASLEQFWMNGNMPAIGESRTIEMLL
jgi:phenylpropionate dioxygenase-like ring-hydroxylating dioxygenase large terminal subunit